MTIVLAAGLAVGGIFSARVSGVLCAVFSLAGAAAWFLFYFHFRSIVYSVENGELVIRGGFFIKAERRIRAQDILWRTSVRFGSVMLFSVLHTAAGRAVIFAKPQF